MRVEFQIFRRQAHGAERRKNARHTAWQGDTLIWESQAHCVAYAEFGTEAGWGTNFLHGFNEPLHKLHGRTGSVFKMEAWTNARVYGDAHGMHIAPCGRTIGPSPLTSGASSLGGCGIRAACDHHPRVLDHSRGWMPALPPLPRTPTVWTPPGLAPRALLVAWSGGSPGEDCESPLDRPLHLGPRRLHAPCTWANVLVAGTPSPGYACSLWGACAAPCGQEMGRPPRLRAPRGHCGGPDQGT